MDQTLAKINNYRQVVIEKYGTYGISLDDSVETQIITDTKHDRY